MPAQEINIQRTFARGKEKYAKATLAHPFATAIIDPDWPYTLAPGTDGPVYAGNGKGRLSGFTRDKGGHNNRYFREEPLTIEQLKALPVGDVVGGYVFLWVVGPFLINGNAAAVMQAWGFEPASSKSSCRASIWWRLIRRGGMGTIQYCLR